MKIGILGGSFDPVHNGHIEMALFCKKEFCLDKIMFLPLGDPPHKQNITDKELRIKMLEAAVSEYDGCFVSRIEADRIGKTYTYDTVLWLKKNTPDEYFYIIGGDTVNTLNTWYMADKLFKILEFIVVDRDKVDISNGIKQAVEMGARLHFAHHTGLLVSSTEVRQEIKSGKISNNVPECVMEIINEHGLYTN